MNQEKPTKGCLLLHGLSATPATIFSLRDLLVTAGFRVSAPALSGHGGDLADLARSTHGDWYQSAYTAFQKLRREVDRLFVAGLSLGALLALKLAINESAGISALALLGTPLILSPRVRAITFAVRYSPLRWIVRSVKKNLEESVADPEGRILYAYSSLPRIPVSSVFELCDLQKEVARGLGTLSHPILFLHGREDTVAPIENVALLKKRLSRAIVENRIFASSRHVITMDFEKEEVAQTVVDFFNRFS